MPSIKHKHFTSCNAVVVPSHSPTLLPILIPIPISIAIAIPIRIRIRSRISIPIAGKFVIVSISWHRLAGQEGESRLAVAASAQQVVARRDAAPVIMANTPDRHFAYKRALMDTKGDSERC